MFHLGWFLGNGFGIQPWHGTYAGTSMTDWTKPDLYRDLTSSLERGGFDFVFIEDTAMIEDTYQGTAEHALSKGQMAPKNDPMPLVPLMVQGSKHIGVISTISTTQYPPYLAARQGVTIDHLTEGRFGMNIVTSVTHRVGQNFGYDKLPPHDERYARAEEWLDVVSKLWNSWEDDALVHDQENVVYADHTKVHTIDHVGEHFSVRGPLNTIPGPQRRPVIAQAGNSVPGREIAARNADTMLAMGHNPEQMKAFRDDMRARAAAHGRNPDDLKVMFLVTPMLGETDEHAQERERARVERASTPEAIAEVLWNMSYISGGEVDFSKFDLDAKMPDIVGNGEQSSMRQYVTGNEDKTLREVATGIRQIGDLGLIGSPDTVAEKMGEIMDYVGGDGFLFYPEMTRRTISEYADGLCPALRKRGLIRSSYEGETLRENLLAF
ncbi:NtaA/DmoA family FMN-dependent monooxygenase [Frondihabitans australicus]|uniref:FMN-dependent oxidoreductase (Nitrilotriacetate monooxygenase family) n=1 Tax=Frondihabitans australicus TaxID=386892 RepID=A0A495IDA1_9MICO|nr:NtaA/DmoA family FMN-dependent monooxygenase [Frondihabitans australicus]RKR73438.1 FMN-dependent oxidoreductase (nitrilotriacetate monooxygenase family) [Frondihabitans australicus]